ncbi:hypothetical protein M434DRAFT_26756 [Hypoxylon sp. CO27-5]|nr:hypothetical protein M434DRAFT_26756 [Hypoxylon sp. CO27-5]
MRHTVALQHSRPGEFRGAYMQPISRLALLISIPLSPGAHVEEEYLSDMTDQETNDGKSHDEADSSHNETDVQTTYATQFYEDEEEHWADSYGGDDEPPTRGGEYTGTVQNTGDTVETKPPPKNNP